MPAKKPKEFWVERSKSYVSLVYVLRSKAKKKPRRGDRAWTSECYTDWLEVTSLELKPGEIRKCKISFVKE